MRRHININQWRTTFWKQ